MKDSPRKLWILGAGRFGSMAAQRLGKKFPEASFTIVDNREDKLEKFKKEPGFTVLEENALSFLSKAALSSEVWIVPAVPVHVAFEWFCARLGQMGRVERLKVPQAVDSQVPNPYRVPSGTVYASFATFLCPDNCSEPENICTSTGKPRPGNVAKLA